MKKVLSLFLSFFVTILSYAQLENANWCFREFAKIDFNSGSPVVGNAANGGFVPVYGGSGASVSSNTGQLLFYTDGIKVWDKNNNVMPNGANIGGGVDGHWNQQTTVIVPKPGSSTLYYIFTVNNYQGNIPSGNAGLHYSVIDLSLNSGNGDVVGSLNTIPLKNHTGTLMDYNYNTNTGLRIFENRISSTLNNDGSKIWLSFFTRFNVGGVPDRWAYQYLIDNVGISGVADGTSPVPTTSFQLDNNNFPSAPNYYQIFGAMKFSPNGNYLCDANSEKVTVYNFDKQTGILSFNRNVYSFILDANPGYGVEFSPNSQLLYFCTYDNKVYQEGLTENNLIIKKFIRIRQSDFSTKKSTPIIIGEFECANHQSSTDNILTPLPVSASHGDLQLALDGKIYVCADFSIPIHSKLGAITLPNVQGVGCNYATNFLTLAANTKHEGSLPQWVHKATPQTGLWTWMKGDNVPNQTGVYGTQNVPDINNKPPARYDAATWTDNSGVFWMFGGTLAFGQLYNDLWKYDKVSNIWTWKKGSSSLNDPGSYGVMNQAGSTNNPGARHSPVTWVDISGNYLWLYGGWALTPSGNTNNQYSDLWRYTIATNEWTWINGSNQLNQYAIYGTQGQPSINNRPGAKGGASAWTDNDGNHLWLFGGDGRSSAYAGFQCDLWRYNINTREWTWMKGTDNTNDPSTRNGIYGTLAIEDAQSRPGVRAGSVTWVDDQNNFWLFGGTGQAENATGDLNDLWMFKKSSGNWIWYGGDKIPNQYGIYGTMGQPNIANKPGARKNSISWKDANGMFWLFSGHGSSSNAAALLNDLWKYDPVQKIWTWTNGSNTSTAISVYGTMGIATPLTNPGGRWRSSGWIDIQNNNLWVFGGITSLGSGGSLNDLWKYTGNCTAPNCFTENVTTTNSLQPIITTKNTNENNALKAFIYPNPTTTNLTLRITENDKQSLAAYNLTVTDKMGGVLLRQANYTSGKGVDISRLESGLYFATLINNKNEKVTVAFSKL